MAQLEKFIKVTQEQYNTLQAGGTVGSHTGINPNFIYLVENNTLSAGNNIDAVYETMNELEMRNIYCEVCIEATGVFTPFYGIVKKEEDYLYIYPTTAVWCKDSSTLYNLSMIQYDYPNGEWYLAYASFALSTDQKGIATNASQHLVELKNISLYSK